MCDSDGTALADVVGVLCYSAVSGAVSSDSGV